MEATLKVIIGLSEPLEKLAREAILALRGREDPEPREPALPEQRVPEPETEPAPEPEPQPEPEADVVPDDETMRTLMDIAITKWAGAGSENSKDPQVLKLRKDVCSSFKQIARHLGAEKPTKLQGDLRNRFLEEIENNLWNDTGKIVWRAF